MVWREIPSRSLSKAAKRRGLRSSHGMWAPFLAFVVQYWPPQTRAGGICDVLTQGVERLAQDPRDVHLRAADPFADLPLEQVIAIAQAQHLAGARVEHVAELLEGDGGVGRAEVVAPVGDPLDACRTTLLVRRDGLVERVGSAARAGHQRIVDVLDADVEMARDVVGGRRVSELPELVA